MIVYPKFCPRHRFAFNLVREIKEETLWLTCSSGLKNQECHILSANSRNGRGFLRVFPMHSRHFSKWNLEETPKALLKDRLAIEV